MSSTARQNRATRLLAFAAMLTLPGAGDAQTILTSDHIRLLIIGRISERLVVLAAAILSLTFGFLSLRNSTTEKGTLEANAQHLFSLKLRNVGPGIFFSLFGTALLLWSLNTKLDLQFPPAADVAKPSAVAPTKVSTQATPPIGTHVTWGVGVPALSGANERRHFLAAILTAERLTVTNRPLPSKAEMGTLSKSIQALEPFKATIVDSEAGWVGAYQWWEKLKRDPRFGSPAFEDQLNEREKESLRAIEQLYKDALGEGQ